MHFEITAEGVQLTDVLCDRVERRLRFTLGRFGDRVERVHVVLSNERSPGGGPEDRCWRFRIAVRGRLPAMLIEQVDSNVEVVIDGAVDRISRAVARRLDPLVAASRALQERTPGGGAGRAVRVDSSRATTRATVPRPQPTQE